MRPGTVLALWTVPRSASTAFERMVIERDDHTVFHEPFSVPYYYGPGKRSLRYDEVREDATPEAVVVEIAQAATRRPVFVKDMAYHLRGIDRGVWNRIVTEWTHSFLVRDPARTLPSFAKHWPDPTAEEAGFEALGELLDAATDAGVSPVVIDSDDLLTDPHGIVRAWCEAVDLEFDRNALSWDPGMRPEWDVWEEWHTDVAASTGLESVDLEPAKPVDDALVELHARCAPVYERLRNLRIRPHPGP